VAGTRREALRETLAPHLVVFMHEVRADAYATIAQALRAIAQSPEIDRLSASQALIAMAEETERLFVEGSRNDAADASAALPPDPTP
jgi:hypothetical protein